MAARVSSSEAITSIAVISLWLSVLAAYTRRPLPRRRSGRIGARPGHDLARPVDDRAIVEHQGGNPAIPAQLLHLAPPPRHVEDSRQKPKAIRADHLRVVTRVLQRMVGVRARMPSGPQGGKRAVADEGRGS